jgi:hypothetical protein
MLPTKNKTHAQAHIYLGNAGDRPRHSDLRGHHLAMQKQGEHHPQNLQAPVLVDLVMPPQ